jgi:hypothetical protein
VAPHDRDRHGPDADVLNVAALPVSMGGMVESFNTPPTTVGTAIVMYSLGVSGFVMLGAKLGQRFGSKIFFQVAVVLFLAAMVLMVTTQNLAAAVGVAVIGTLVVGVLSSGVMRQVTDNPLITAEMKAEVDLGSINFLNNDRLRERFESTKAAAGQVAEAVRINTETRLQALKVGFVVLAGLALLAIIPCGWLPDYKPGDIPGDQPARASRRA